MRLLARCLAVTIFSASVIVSSTGCRAIRRIGDSRQSLDAKRLSRVGMERMRRGQWTEAEQSFNQALAISNLDDRAHRGLAETHWNRGDLDIAIEHMEKAAELSASDPRVVGRLGEMYLHQGRLNDAKQQSEIALAADRNSAEVWALRGDCLRAEGDHDSALAAYHRALALNPEFVDAKLSVAELYLSNNQYDRLLATLDRLDPTGDESVAPTRVHMLRGIAMRNLGRPALATKHFTKATLRDPSRAEPHLQLAAIALENGQPVLASQSIAKAMELDRSLVETTGWSAYLLTPEQMIALQNQDPAQQRR